MAFYCIAHDNCETELSDCVGGRKFSDELALSLLPNGVHLPQAPHSAVTPFITGDSEGGVRRRRRVVYDFVRWKLHATLIASFHR